MNIKKIFVSLILLIFFFLFFSYSTFASQKSSQLPAITIINLIRPNDLGHEKDDLVGSLKAQYQVTREAGVNATWLLQYSVLENPQMVDFAKRYMPGQEFGLLFEIDKNFAEESGVQYKGQGPWYFSDGLLLQSYDTTERKQLIDTAFAKFKATFGYYPKTVGAWWIGGEELTYMQQKYGIVAALKAADQYNLDAYSIIGSPWDIPYISSKTNEGMPAATWDDSSKVVILQWAARDPVNGYLDPIYSAQDYTTRQYDPGYLNHLASILLHGSTDNLVFGLENGATLPIFDQFYKTAVTKAKELQDTKISHVLLVKDFAQNFLHSHAVLPATSYFLANDYKTNDQAFWYNSVNYRAGIIKKDGIVSLVDVRNYTKKVDEDFATLPNVQWTMEVNEPSFIDSQRFPQLKIILATTSDQLEIRKNGSTILLFNGPTKIAVFTPDLLKVNVINKGIQSFRFQQPSSEVTVWKILLIMYICYFIFLYVYRKSLLYSLFEILLLAIPLFIAQSFLQSNELFLFDKKELWLLYLLPLLRNFSITQSLMIINILPFIILFICQYLCMIQFPRKLTQYIYAFVLAFAIIMYAHVSYIPLNKTTYKGLAIELAIISLVIIITGIIVFVKTHSKKIISIYALAGIGFLGCVVGILVLSRTELAVTSFEIQALQFMKTTKKDVIWVNQTDNGIIRIYRSVKPLLYDKYTYGSKMTSTHWQLVMRPENHILKLSNYQNKLIVIPRYIGADISDYEIQQLGIKKIFDNAQIAIYEKQ